MKASSKLTKKEQPKGENANGKEITNSEPDSGLTTPETMARSRKSLEVGVMHGFLNFFDINFDRLHFSQHTDQCLRINSPEDF
jgi:hypothetical protein